MALLFNANNAHLDGGSLSHNIGTGDFTWSAWVNRSSLVIGWRPLWANGGTVPCVFSNYSGSAWEFYWLGASGSSPFNTTLSANVWYHLAVVRSGTTVTGYVNGVAETNTYTINTSMSNVAQHVASDGGSQYLDGTLAEIALWNAALSANELAAMAKGVLPGRMRPLNIKAWWPLWGIHSPEIDLGPNNIGLTVVGGPPVAANHAPVDMFSDNWWGNSSRPAAVTGLPPKPVIAYSDLFVDESFP